MPASSSFTPHTKISDDRRTLSLLLCGRVQEWPGEPLSPAGWQRLVHAALGEGVAPLVYCALLERGELARLPGPQAEALRAAYFSTLLNNRATIQELESLAQRFAQAGIPVVALKGICYALTIYPDPGLRPMVDLDLLAPAAALPEAVRIAKTCGYVEAAPEASPGLRALLNHEICLKKASAPYTTLELHYSLVADRAYSYAVPMGWFWSQTEPLAGPSPDARPGDLRMLSPVAQLLYACAHAMLQHGGRNSGLRWLYDLDRIVRVYAERLDWDQLVSQARVFHWGSAVEAALSQAVDLFDTPAPPQALAALQVERDRNAGRVDMLQAAPATHLLEEFQKFQSLNWTGRARFVLGLAVPTPAYMRWRYGLKGSWTLPAWYFVRWGGIFKDALRTAVVLLRHAFLQPKNAGSRR